MADKGHWCWYQQRKQGCWVYEHQKDAVNKPNPNLLPWDGFSEDEKEKNRTFIRGISRLLARAGIQIERQF